MTGNFLTDTHTHMYLAEFDEDGGAAAVDRAMAAGVGMMILPNVGVDTIRRMKSLHALRPETTRMAMGLHPTEVVEDWRDMLAVIDGELRYSPESFVAIGEIGLDLYWDRSFRNEQMKVFDYQCDLAAKMNLPVIIHCREALDETLEVLSGYHGLTGVMHSFGGSSHDVERVRSRNDLFFGINGIATFKNAKLDDTIREITSDRLLLETDSPYLAPVPHRGKRNESAFLVNICNKCAGVLERSVEEITNVTTANARGLFRF